MKGVFLSLAVFVATSIAASATVDESTLRKELQAQGADYCYRFTSWSENPKAPQYVIALYFFRAPAGKDGSYQVYDGDIPKAARAVVVIDRRKAGASTRKVLLDAKEAGQMIQRIGYSGFFATDSIDPTKRYLDGHGLTAERIYSGDYVVKTRSYKQHLSCKWLYDYFEQFTK